MRGTATPTLAEGKNRKDRPSGGEGGKRGDGTVIKGESRSTHTKVKGKLLRKKESRVTLPALRRDGGVC